MAITKDAGRQTTLTADVDFTFASLTNGSAEAAIDLPNGAVVTGGFVVVDTAFSTGATLDVGDGGDDDRYTSTAVAVTTGRTAITLTGYEYTAADTIDITMNSTATAGAARLVVEYYVDGRSSEVQA